MKKILLFGIVGFASAVVQAQLLIPTRTMGTAIRKEITDTYTPGLSSIHKKGSRGPAIPFYTGGIGLRENVGKTTYDLQTNGSMQRRVLAKDNEISCFWTFSSEPNATFNSLYTDRGTGYAYFNGVTWSSAPTARLENDVRTGFMSAFVTGTNQEAYITHNGIDNTLHYGKKTGSTWSLAPLGTSLVNEGIWPHAAASGNWLYVVTSAADSNKHTNGIRNGYYFSRSNDNGTTWIDNAIALPLVDSVGHYRAGGNSYAISARGDNVAILLGDMGSDLTLLTSGNNGATWSKKVVWDWPIDNFNLSGTTMADPNGDGVADTILTNDGSQTLALDDNGVAHVAFPLVRILKTGPSFSFFLNSVLGYYNTVADSVISVDNSLLRIHDCDGDNTISIGANYSDGVIKKTAIYNTIGTITQPSITIVKGSPTTPQKILIAYTQIMDGDTTIDDPNFPNWAGSSFLEGQNYRDVFVVGTQDSSKTWSFPVNVSRSMHFEEAFPSTPEIITGNTLPILYQGDIEPGTIMQSEDDYDATFENIMILQNVPIADIFSADSTAPCGQTELPLGVKNIVSNNFNVINIFPNPTTDQVSFTIPSVSSNENVSYTVLDLAGRIVLEGNTKKSSINVTSLMRGIYTLRIESSTQKVSGKFIKE
jgi:hypothetical protein